MEGEPLNTTVLGQYGHSKPVYPSSRTGAGGWDPAYERARAFVEELTLAEKAAMVTGVAGPCIGNVYPIPWRKFSGICLQDGHVSLRVAEHERNLAMGREFRAKGAHVALAPAAGARGRSVYGGRNWEGFWPDPYISGVAMELSVRGIQDAGVQAVAKHLLANKQEILCNPEYYPNGTLQFEAISSNVDDRTLPSMMRSYQRLDGSYACQNSKLLNGILKEKLGFQGYIMSDWFALHAGIDALEAGKDMDMSGRLRSSTPVPELGQMSSHFGGNITTMVQNSTLDEARLNAMITRLITPYFHLHQDVQNEFPTVDGCLFSLPQLFLEPEYLAPGLGLFNLTGPTSIRDAHNTHAALIRKQAAESTVLLKNTNNALALRPPRYIDIFGNDAGETQNGPVNHFGNEESWMYGTCGDGGGSATGRLSYVTTPQEALKARAIQDGTLVETWLNNKLIATSDVTSLWFYRGSDVCLGFLKSWARETIDRESLHLVFRKYRVA